MPNPRLYRPLPCHFNASAWSLAGAGAALVLALCGCASVPVPDPPLAALALPPAWVSRDVGVVGAATAPTPLSGWWQHFGDPLLTDLVRRALQANTSIGVAQAALRQARALRDVAAAALRPTLGSSASAQRSDSGEAPPSNRFRVTLDASWEPDFFGVNQSALDATDALAHASAATLADTQLAIAAEVALNYISLCALQTRLTIARDNLASQQETLQLTDWRLQAGLLSALEAEQALAAVAQTQAQLPALQTGIEQARFALAVLLGLPPAALADELAVARPVPLAPGALALSIPADTLRQRPDVRAAQYQVSAALARLAQAEAARAPNFTLSGSLGLSALTLSGLGHRAAVVGALLGAVSLPVFDGGAANAQVRAQQAALAQAGLAYRASVLGALKDVESALVALHGERLRLLHLQQAAQAAGNAAQMARQRYRSGLVDFSVVLETQRSQLSTQEALASAAADVSADQVRLYKTLGGGWVSQPEPISAAPTDQPAATPSPRF